MPPRKKTKLVGFSRPKSRERIETVSWMLIERRDLGFSRPKSRERIETIDLDDEIPF